MKHETDPPDPFTNPQLTNPQLGDVKVWKHGSVTVVGFGTTSVNYETVPAVHVRHDDDLHGAVWAYGTWMAPWEGAAWSKGPPLPARRGDLRDARRPRRSTRAAPR